MLTSHQPSTRELTEQLWLRVQGALRGRVPLCVLHEYRSLEDLLESGQGYPAVPPEIDTAVPARHLRSGVARRLRDAGLRVVQQFWHEATGQCLVIAERVTGQTFAVLRLDIASDFRYDGRVFLTERELSRAQRTYGGLTVLTADVEFGYYLTKKIAKAALTPRRAARLSAIYREDPAGCRRMISRFWGDRSAELLCRAAEGGDWASVIDRQRALRAELRRRAVVAAPQRVISYWIRELGRVGHRCLWPAGLHVALVGLDGPAASAVASRSAAALAFAFKAVRVEAGNARRGGAELSLPHACLRLVESAGRYWARVRPLVARRRLVLSDQDVVGAIVDSRRGGSVVAARVLRSIARLAPRPDLVIHLDATQPLEDTVADVVDAILSCLEARTARRLGL